MSLSRREALHYFGALFALPLAARNGLSSFITEWPVADDPLRGTIAQYQAGRLRGEYTALEVTLKALESCRTTGARLKAIDVLADTAAAEARASDARLRNKTLRSPLDGVPLFAKSIYDVQGAPTSASSAEWARLFPGPVRRDAIEVERLRAGGAVVLGKTAADDFAYRGNGTSSFSGQVLNPYDAAWRSAPSAPTTAGPIAFRRNSPVWWG
jgi:Asp-tRNA(Asn)/Glu-tRNA(Gln) amidotransferase A subunit family amidase